MKLLLNFLCELTASQMLTFSADASLPGQAYSFISTLKMYKPLSYGMKFARGSEWFVLSRGFVNYLTTEIKKRNSAMHEIWTDALLLYQPDETFFHTALLNSPLCLHNAKRHMHYISTILPEKIQHGSHDEIGTRSPAYLTEMDFQQLLLEKAKRPIFFARKFGDATHQPTIKLCQRIDRQATLTSQRPTWWPGLPDWLEEHLAEWIDLKPSNASCSSDPDSDETDETETGIRLLGREPPLPNDSIEGEAQRSDLRFAPEVWVLQHSGVQYGLVERFAVQGHARGFGLALLAARVGTGWSETAERFTEHVNIVAADLPVSLATYWAPHLADIGDLPQVLVDWGNCVVKRRIHEAHLWGSPLVIPSCQTPSIGLQRVRLKLERGTAQALAWLDFLTFQRMDDVPLEQMRRFFELESRNLPLASPGAPTVKKYEHVRIRRRDTYFLYVGTQWENNGRHVIHKLSDDVT